MSQEPVVGGSITVAGQVYRYTEIRDIPGIVYAEKGRKGSV